MPPKKGKRKNSVSQPSTSSPTKQDPPAKLPTPPPPAPPCINNFLPFELVFHALLLGAVDLQYAETWSARCQFLLWTSLVCKRWGVLSQRLLWSHVILLSEAQANAALKSATLGRYFTRKLEISGGTTLKGGAGVTGVQVHKLLPKTIGLVELELRNFGKLWVIGFYLFRYPNLKYLLFLTLKDVAFVTDTWINTNPAFSLETLKLHNYRNNSHQSFTFFFSPTLRNLELHSLSTLKPQISTEPPEHLLNREDLNLFLLHSSPHLTSLDLGSEPKNLWIPQLSSCTSLKHLRLSFPSSADIIAVRLIPVHLVTLSIALPPIPTPAGRESAEDILKTLHTAFLTFSCFEQLEKVLVDASFAVFDGLTAWNSLETVLVGRGIDLNLKVV